MHSQRVEIFGLLAAFTFLDEYCRFFGLTLNSEVRYYCDNQEVINKLIEIELRKNNKRYDNDETEDDAGQFGEKQCMNNIKLSVQQVHSGQRRIISALKDLSRSDKRVYNRSKLYYHADTTVTESNCCILQYIRK